MRVKIIWSALAAAAIATSAFAQEDVRFDIVRFQVDGNSLLPQDQVDGLVTPFVGKKRVYGDVQKALEALENAYRKAGYGTVQVFVPEQELAAGVVRLVVTEAVISKVAITGNKHFDNANIRNSLRELQEGKAPNLRLLSENVQLANDNPAKQVEVTLGVAEEEGRVNAKIDVSDSDPSRFIVNADNTGTPNGGRHRISLAYQHANLFNNDQALTLAVTGSPDLPRNQELAVASVAYRLPIYDMGDSLDFAYGKSNVNSPVAQQTGVSVIGKGEVFVLRWNHYLPRSGEYSSRVVFGYDYKNVDAQTCVGVCTGPVHVVQPVSVAYVGNRTEPGSMLNYSLGAAAGRQTTSIVPGNPTPPPSVDFTVYRLASSYMRVLDGNWTARAAFSGQYSPSLGSDNAGIRKLLPDVEKFGVVGSNAVRGFYERAVTGDSGYYLNLELYSPDYAKEFEIPGSLKFLGFIDLGQGYNYQNAVAGAPPMITDAASWGVGLRYGYSKDVTFKLDVAQVLAAGNANLAGTGTPAPGGGDTVGTGDQVAVGDLRGHFALQISF